MIKQEFLKEVIDELSKVQPGLSLHINSYNDLKNAVSDHLNNLITNNFSLLISVLYRLDISERKLKELLGRQSGIPAAEIIAEMIIERQLQKIDGRKAFKNSADNISDEERW